MRLKHFQSFSLIGCLCCLQVLETVVDSLHSVMITQDDLQNACEAIEVMPGNLLEVVQPLIKFDLSSA